MTDIHGKVVVLTGASSGIGEATARLLADRGAIMVLGARRIDRLNDLAAQVEEAQGTVVTLQTDVRRPEDVQALVQLALDRFGKLDVLVSNAGIGPSAPLDDNRVEDWHEMVDININGLLHGVAAALPIFRRQGFGHFVTTGSTAAYKTVATQTVYSGTKFAQKAIMEGLRQEAGANLRTTLVSPGFIYTDFTANTPDPELKAQMVAAKEAIAISPNAIAGAIAYAIEQPDDVEISEIVVRPTAQG